ncbi:MAG: sulfatase family protein [Roseibacillus sp.]
MKLKITLVSSILCAGSVFAEEKPNIILIYADDLGYGDLSCYGATKVKTPRIDSLATEGRLFSDGHSPSAVCTPSRYSLLTAEYPFRKSIYAPIFLKNKLIIPEDAYTVADLMKGAGYQTGIIGKWHLGFQDKTPVDWNAPLKPGPLELGFDYYYGVPTVNSHPPFVYVENHHVVGHVYDSDSPDYDPFDYQKGAGTQGYTEKHHEKLKLDDIGGSKAAHALFKDHKVGLHLAEKAVDWIDSNKEDPFFLIFSTTHIHHPFTPAPQFQGTSEAGPYGDFLHELDYIVGLILDKIETEELSHNTLIIFTADNGGMLNTTGQEAWEMGHHMNGPLLGFKSDGWEGGHRVPFIAKWPARIPSGTKSNQLISAIDLMPTFSTFTDTPLSPKAYTDGVDMSEAFTGNPASQIRENLICTPIKKDFLVVRKDQWAYLGGRGSAGWNGNARSHVSSGAKSTLFTGRENSDLVDGAVSKNAPPAQLYDLEKDLSQTTNLYYQNLDMVKEFDAILKSYRPAPPKQRKKTKQEN